MLRPPNPLSEGRHNWHVNTIDAHGQERQGRNRGLRVKTTPSAQWTVSRELRERIKAAFDEEGIEIPFPQQTVWHRSPAPVGQSN